MPKICFLTYILFTYYVSFGQSNSKDIGITIIEALKTNAFNKISDLRIPNSELKKFLSYNKIDTTSHSIKEYIKKYPGIDSSLILRCQEFRNEKEKFQINWDDIQIVDFKENTIVDDKRENKASKLSAIEFKSNEQNYLVIYETVEWPIGRFRLANTIIFTQATLSKN